MNDQLIGAPLPAPAAEPTQALPAQSPLSIITEPEVAIIMEGVIQVRFPASKTTQMLFDLAIPAGKERPGTLTYVNQEAQGVAKAALKVFQNTLRQSPGLRPVDGNMVLSYVVVERKLQYVFQLGVRTK